MFLFDFLPEKWRIVHENPISARIYHEVLKTFAESFQFLAEEIPPSPLIGNPAHELVRCFNVRPNMSTVKKLAMLPSTSNVGMPT